jgi:peptide/nickel transport system permease protein
MVTPTEVEAIPVEAVSSAPSSRPFLTALRSALRRNKVAQVAVVILFVVVIVGVFAPLIAPHDPQAQDLTARLKPPFWLQGHAPGHLLGTDELGRDVLSRAIYGTRISLLVGVSATLLSGAVGSLIGMICGYYRGWIDVVFMRLADVQLSFPTLLLALVIVAVVGQSLWFVILVLGGTGWVSYARVIRAEVLSLRSREFVTAARAVGTSDVQIMWRHLRPNVIAPLLTIGTLQVASMIVAESSLSYLGLGVPPTIPTWGGMLSAGQLYLRSAWWISVFSGLAIMLTTLSINIAGDMLRDVADPKAYQK